MRAMLIFSPGEYIPAANLTILGVYAESAIKNSTRYRVRLGCCGVECILTHDTIRKRIRTVSLYCQRCGITHHNTHRDEGFPPLLRAQAFLPHDILPAGVAWPRPPSLTQPRIWGAQA